MNQDIINSITAKLQNYDDELKGLIKELIEDYEKKNTRLDKIVSQSDKQQLELIKLNEKLEESYEKLKIASETDKLTSLNNRLKSEETLNEYIDKNTAFSALMIDIDDFQTLNDKFDLIESNKILVEFSKVLKKIVGDNIFIGRWSGDIFIVIDKNSTLDEIIDKAEDIVEGVENNFFTTAGKITVSIGASSSQKNTTLKDIVVSLESALRKAKNNGKNQVSI